MQMPIDPGLQLAWGRHCRRVEQADDPSTGPNFSKDVVEHQLVGPIGLRRTETVGIRQDQFRILGKQELLQLRLKRGKCWPFKGCDFEAGLSRGYLSEKGCRRSITDKGGARRREQDGDMEKAVEKICGTPRRYGKQRSCNPIDGCFNPFGSLLTHEERK